MEGRNKRELGARKVSCGKEKGRVGHDCNDLLPAAIRAATGIPRGGSSNQGDQQAEKVSVERRGGRTGGCRT
jgi:hypothetical protein